MKREWPAVDNSYHRPVYYSRQQAAFRVGQRAARSIPERWPAEPLAGIHLLRFKAIDARMIFVEAAMNAPRSPTLPQWKIDLVQAAITCAPTCTGRTPMHDFP